MACRLIGTKPLSEHIFIEETSFQNVVWKMTAILSRPQSVKHTANWSMMGSPIYILLQPSNENVWVQLFSCCYFVAVMPYWRIVCTKGLWLWSISLRDANGNMQFGTGWIQIQSVTIIDSLIGDYCIYCLTQHGSVSTLPLNKTTHYRTVWELTFLEQK